MEIMLFKSSICQLEAALNALSDSLCLDAEIFAATHPGPFKTHGEGLQLVRSAIVDLYYGEGSTDGRCTPVCLGAVGVASRVIELVRDANGAKDRFQQAAQDLISNMVNRKGGALSVAGRAKALRGLLSDIGYGRLSLRQCYRHIPIVEYTPSSLRFSYSSGGRSIRRITIEKAVAILDKMGYESQKSMIEREKLANMPGDTVVAQVQNLAGYYKANVHGSDEGDIETIPAFLPIFYPYDANAPIIRQPELPQADDSRRLARRSRSDKKLEDTPLASTIRLYAYRQGF
jgi:hypothetical protein